MKKISSLSVFFFISALLCNEPESRNKIPSRGTVQLGVIHPYSPLSTGGGVETERFRDFFLINEVNSLTLLYTHNFLITLSPHLLASPSHHFQPFFHNVPHELVAFILFYDTFNYGHLCEHQIEIIYWNLEECTTEWV